MIILNNIQKRQDLNRQNIHCGALPPLDRTAVFFRQRKKNCKRMLNYQNLNKSIKFWLSKMWFSENTRI